MLKQINIKKILLSSIFLISNFILGQSLVINEINGYAIEIYNGTSADIDLLGYHLTDDDNITKWTFGPHMNTEISSVVEANNFITLYSQAFPLDQRASYNEYRTTVRASGGNKIRLFDFAQNLVDEVEYPLEVPENYSFGRKTNGDYFIFATTTFGSPTKDGTNDESSIYFVDKDLIAPKITANSGIFNSQVMVTINSQGSSLPIYYTTDGSMPRLESTLYTGPFNINSTSVVRCAHLNPDGSRGLMDMRTLLFDVSHELPILNITSSYYTPAGIRNNIGSHGPTNFEGRIWIEMNEKNGEVSMAQYATYERSGNSSVYSLPQLNGKIKRIKTEEPKHLPNSVFPNKPQIEKVKSFQIRNGSQNYNYTKLRSPFVSQLVSQDQLIDFGFQDYRPCIVYLNGIYQGILNIREDDDPDFIKHNFPGKEDFVEPRFFRRIQGIFEDLWPQRSLVIGYPENKRRTDSLDKLYGYDNYFFYTWVSHFTNSEEMHAEIYAFTDDETPTQWVCHDADVTFNHGFTWPPVIIGPMEMTWSPDNINTIHFRELENNAYLRDRMVQAWCSYKNFMFDEERTVAILDEMEAVLEPEIQGQADYNQNMLNEFAKWDRFSTGWNNWGSPFTDLATWKNEVDKIRQALKIRAVGIEEKIRVHFNLPDLVELTAAVNDEKMGYVRIEKVKLRNETMKGTFFSQLNLRAEATPKIGYRFSHWEGVSSSTESEIVLNLAADSELTAIFEPIPFEVVELHLNEVQSKNDKTYADEQGEFNDWAEIYNSDTKTIDLAGYYLSDNRDITNKYQIQSTDASKTSVEPKDFIIFWLDKDTAQGPNHINFKLKGDDQIYLIYPDGLTILDSLNFDLEVDKSFGLKTDGGAPLVYFDLPTPDSTNNITIDGAGLSDKALGFTVFPNPTASKINIVLEGSTDEGIEWILFNSFGQKLDEGTTQSIDVERFAKGVYLLKVNDKTLKIYKY